MNQLLQYYLALCFANITRGAFIVTIAWTALEVGGTLASVGLVFVISHSVNVFLGPLVGNMIDRRPKRVLVVVGQLINAVAMLLPLILQAGGLHLTQGVIGAVAALSALGLLAMSGALDAIQQSLTVPELRTRVSAVAGGVRQGAMVAGTGLAGFGIHYLSPAATFAGGALCCVATAALMYGLNEVQGRAAQRETFWQGIRTGFVELYQFPALLRLGLLTAIGFSVGQLSNALLPSLVRDDLGGDSRLFGIVDSLWSVGGISLSLAVAVVLRAATLRNFEYIAGALLGLATMATSLVSTEPALMVLYFFLGGLFSITKVLCDGRVLEVCPEELVGRVRTHYQTLISLFGLGVYLSPTVFAMESARTTFLTWGAAVVVLAATLWMAAKSERERTRLTVPDAGP